MRKPNWEAVDKDGNSIWEVNPNDESTATYKDIDRATIDKFVMYLDGTPQVIINLDPNKRLIYRRRVAIDQNSKVKMACYIVGYQELVNGKNVQALNFLFDKPGEEPWVETTDGFKEGHSWYYPVIFIEEETL